MRRFVVLVCLLGFGALPREAAAQPVIDGVVDAAYGAPVSPEVNAKAILAEKPLEHAQGDAVFAKTVDITGRDFGLAVKRVPALGKDVAIAVLRSET